MKLRTFYVLFCAGYLIGGAYLTFSHAQGWVKIAWCLLFLVGQFFVIRCPYCDRYAGPWIYSVGTKCKHCGEPY
jgi:hypothetical protein